MTVAFIPVRGGSKSIPLKNIKNINGKPLVYWALRAAQESRYIDEIYVSTDSRKIEETVRGFCFDKVKMVKRSDETATDTASTESAMLEFAKTVSFDHIVLIQATSPLLSEEDLNRGFECLSGDCVDSVMSVVRQKRFIWRETQGQYIIPENYDPFHRPRRQEFEGFLVENGAFYITSRERLLETGIRVSGNIGAVEMDADSYFEIDEESDWLIAEALLKNKYNKSEIYPDIKLFLTDCDGCLTDGGMYYSENGDELKKFNTRDGVAFSMLKKKGILSGIITGEKRELNQRRADKLEIDVIEQECGNKLDAVLRLCEKYEIGLEDVAYVGDDVNDLDVMEKVGFSACPADAVMEVRQAADMVTTACGGQGVIREVVDTIWRG